MIVVPEDLMRAAIADGRRKTVRAEQEAADSGREPNRIRIKARIRGGQLRVQGYVRHGKRWDRDDVLVVPAHGELFSRFRGLLETDAISGKHVLIIGQGSGGAPVTLGLVQSGVMNLTLIDHDVLMVGNIMRHPLGLSDVGRYKTKALADFILQKNPHAKVRTLETQIGWDNIDLLRREVERADLVVGATDNRISKLVINRACVEAGKTLIIGTAFRRAYGGQVLRVRPHRSLCYQCFLDLLPESAQDQEISSIEQAEGLAYTDRPVAIEPGLASDLAPICLLIVKLAIQELIAGIPTTLRSLDEDFAAPLYRWINRREKDTDCERWKPLAFDIDGLHPLRWYGMAIPKHPGCSVCGDYVAETCREAGVSISQSDLDFFRVANAEGSKDGDPT